jgi:hypothetical protein
MQAFAAFTTLAAPLGLNGQPAKCAVYSANDAAASVAQPYRTAQEASRICFGYAAMPEVSTCAS